MSSEISANPPAYEMYEIDVLGFPPRADIEGRFGINNHGQIAYARRNVATGAFRAMVYLHCDAYGFGSGVWDLAHEFRDEFGGLILTGDSYARDIGDQGVIVGQFGGIVRGEGRALAIDLTGTMGIDDHVAVWPPIDGDPPADECSDWGRAVAVTGGFSPQVVIERGALRSCTNCCNETEYIDCFATGAMWSELSGVSTVASFAFVGCPEGDASLPSTFAHDAEYLDESSGVLAMAGHAERDAYLTEFGCFADACGGCWESMYPLRWSQSGMASLDRPTQQYSAWARGTNVDAHVVGYARVQPNPGGQGTCHFRAVLWAAGTSIPTKLHTDVVHTFASRSRAESINRRSAGVGIVGWNPDVMAAPQPLLWTQQAASLSDWDGWELQIGSSASYRAVIDCPDPGLDCADVELREAFDINDHGWIIAWGVRQDDETDARFRLYLLIPVDDDVCGRFGDLNQDGVIDSADLLLLLDSWGQCGCTAWCPADFNGNGTIDSADLVELLANWGLCAGESMGLPQSVSDCIARVGLDPVALSACISVIE